MNHLRTSTRKTGAARCRSLDRMTSNASRIGLAVLLMLVLSVSSDGQQLASTRIEFPKPVPPPKRVESSLNALTNPPLKSVSPGVFELGQVRLDKARRCVSFPGSVNMDIGPLEYLLVAKWGKTHEGVLRTEVEPFQIHLAMLLIDGAAGGRAAGARIGPDADIKPRPEGEGFIANPPRAELAGDKVGIEVSWNAGGKRMHRPAEELVFNAENGAALTNGAWVYNGSRVWDGKFMAQAVGSIVSLVTDPDAQVNNMLPGHDNDRIWHVNTNAVPPVDTPVQITITLGQPAGK